MRPPRLILASILLATAVPFLGGGPAVAIGGEPDPTFDGGGVRIDASRPVLDVANAAGTDPFGPVTVAGATGDRMAVARYSASGEAAQFGGDGLVTADFGVPAVAHALAGPGDVIAVGEAGGDLAAAVFDRIGQPQSSFGRSGRLVVPLGGQSAGQAVTDRGLVAGWVVRNGHRDVLLAQLSASGLDTTFNGTGTRVVDLAPGADDAAFAIVDVASGGRFYLAGQLGPAAVVARFSGGSLDPGFGIAGMVVLDVTAGVDVARAIRVDSETGQLIVAGQAGARAFVARLTADGAPVPAFGGGVVQVDFGGNADMATAVAARPGGAVLVSGTRTTSSGTDGAARRLTGAGAVDSTFGDAGLVVADFGSTSDRANALGVQQSDGRFVLVGGNGVDMVMAGFTASGGTDTAFGTAGKVVRDGGSPSSDVGHVVRLHPDGRIVALGSAGGQLVLARRLPDGRPDPSFGAGGPVLDEFGNAGALDAVAQADGSLLVLVSTTDASGNSTGRVVRYLADGRRDPSFGMNGNGAAVNGPGARSSLRVLADGRILVAAKSWTGYNGVARLLADGTPDVAFGDQGFATVGALGAGGAIGVQSDGTILLAVVARDVYAAVHVARLSAGGAVDSSFGYLLHGVGGFPVVRVLPDDRLYVAGSVPQRGNVSGTIEADAMTIARLGRDGYPDTTFGSNGLVRVDPGTGEIVTDAVLDGTFLAVLGVFIDGGSTMRAGLFRFTASGTLDGRYGSNGSAVLDGSRNPWGLARDDGGRMLVIGTRPGPPDADMDLIRLQAGPSTEPTPPPTTSPPTTSAPTTSPPTAPSPVTTVTRPAPVPRRVGYWMVSRLGGTYAFGDASYLGGAPTTSAVDIEPTPTGRGYWIVDATGSVHARGDARYAGGLNGTRLAGGEEVTSLSATPSGGGYWLFTTRGRAVAFGDATFRGDMGAVPLNGPVLDSVVTPSGLGYYLVASDGGIFAFGDARFQGSMGGRRLNAPVQSLVPDGDGTGYWLVASDGGVFAFDAPFRGSMGGARLSRPVTGMVRFGRGYLMVGEDGGIFNFSDRPFLGSLGASPPPSPITAVAALDQ